MVGWGRQIGWAFAVLWAAFPAGALAEHTAVGHIQIKAAEGVEIVLDGAVRAKAEGPEGVIFRDVVSGPHRMVAQREGYLPKYLVAHVTPGMVTLERIEAWQPAVNRAAPATGALMVQTFPVDATIQARKLGWKKLDKGEGPFVAPFVPVGTHRFTFCNAYKCIDFDAEVEGGRLLALLVDFDPGEVLDVTLEHQAAWTSWRRECVMEKDLSSCKQACDMDLAVLPAEVSASCLALYDLPDPLLTRGEPPAPLQEKPAAVEASTKIIQP